MAVEPRIQPSRAVIPIGIAATLALLGDLALFASLPLNVEVVGLAVANLGLVFSIHRILRLFGNPLVGVLINQRRRRPFFFLGMTLATLSTLGYVFANGLPVMIISRLLWGSGWSLVFLTSMAIVMDVTEESNRGRWMGTFNTFYLIGIAFGSLLGGFLSDWIGFRMAMVVCVVLTVLGGIQAVIFLPETLVKQQEEESKVNEEKNVFFDRVRAYFQTIFSTRGLPVLLLIYMGKQFAAEGIALSLLAIMLQVHFGDGVTVLGLLIGIASLNGLMLAFRYLLSALLSPILGSLSDRMKNGRYWLLAFSLAVSVISFGMIAWCRSLPWIIFAMVLNAIDGAGSHVALGAMVANRAPKASMGKVLGLYATAGDLGSAFGPMYGYYMLNFVAVGNVFVISGGLLLGLCLLGLFGLREPVKPREQKLSPDPSA